MDVVISEAVATDAGDPLPCQADPLVCLDTSWDLKTLVLLVCFLFIA